MPNFYDAFETAWNAFGLGPGAPLPLYRGDKNDPQSLGTPPPFAVYQIVVDNRDRRSTGSSFRDRLVNIDCWHKTPGQSLDLVDLLRGKFLKRQAGAWFHEYVLPSNEAVMDMDIWQFTQSQDDLKKTSYISQPYSSVLITGKWSRV